MGIPRFMLNQTVFDAAIDRCVHMYEAGDRIVVSFSGGKDSTVCLELAIIAAKLAGKLPVDVAMRDDEIMFPGTFEYCERVAARTDEVRFWWIVQNQPVINMFAREMPYFWCFDPLLSPEQWVRQPPEWATYLTSINIERIIHPEIMPPPEGKRLVAIIGMRVQESMRRRRGLYSSGSYMTKPNRFGVLNSRPIYDWTDGDIWKAIYDHKWDYNDAYDVMHRLGVSRNALRIAPPTQTQAAIDALWVAARAWPRWFETVCARLPGIRSAAMFGKRSILPYRALGQTWEEVYRQQCIKDAPAWIAERAQAVMDSYLGFHARHSDGPFPEVAGCSKCGEPIGAWKRLAYIMYMGDAFSLKQSVVPAVDPERFRPGSGTWEGGKPTW